MGPSGKSKIQVPQENLKVDLKYKSLSKKVKYHPGMVQWFIIIALLPIIITIFIIITYPDVGKTLFCIDGCLLLQ